MSFVSFVCAVSFFWLVLYGFQQFLSRRRRELPLPYHRRSVLGDGRASNCRVNLRFLQVRVETSSLNGVHDRILSKLRKRKGTWSRLWMERFYTLGYVAGIIGMGIALGLLVRTTWVLMKPLPFHKVMDVSKAVGRLMKRDGPIEPVRGEAVVESPITPILPGVTVPLNHLPIIFLALFLSQIVHEAGHAISGALYGIPILSSGASVTVCVPAAFVSFSSAALDTLRPPVRSRIIAAGPFHSLLFWCFWLLAGHAGSRFLYPVLGYKDMSSFGRIVLDVADASPLAGYLTPGTLVTKLNDHPMGSSHADPDPWSSFLNSPKSDEMSLGWCVDPSDFGSTSKDCCLPDETINPSPLACFVADSIPNQIGCLDPTSILTTVDETTRCASESDCKNKGLCVRPAEKEALLRLTVKESGRNPDKVILWSGPRKEIWEEVTVGIWLPRFSYVPVSIPWLANILWEYLLMVNLSLFLFNLVPIAGLDGSHLLRSFLESLAESNGTHEAYDLDALERASTHSPFQLGGEGSLRYAKLEAVISRGATLLVGLSVTLSLVGLVRT